MSTRHRTGVPRVFSFGPPPTACRPPSKYPHRRTIHWWNVEYPHRTRIRWWNVVTTIANYCLLLFTLFVLLVGLVDIGHSFIYSNRASKVADLSITFGTYAGVIIFGLILVITRTVANKRAIIAIPKGYLPTKATDVPKKASELIQNDYERACIITKVAQPSGRNQAGWGRPGTSCEDINFRSGILATVPALRAALLPLYPTLLAAYPSSTPRSAPLSPLAPLLALPPSASPLPDALRPLADLYESHLVRARYAKPEPTERDWAECTKAVAVFVGVLSGLERRTAAGA
ncbi:hypothetical protein JCM8208_006348 [Rhodotorula glutinis]